MSVQGNTARRRHCRRDVNPTEEAARLAAEHPIEAISVYRYALSGFEAFVED